MTETTTEELVEAEAEQVTVATTLEADELAYAAPVGSYRGENTGPNYTTGQWVVLAALVILNVIVVLLAIMALTGRLTI
jgi:hypothetical protein